MYKIEHAGMLIWFIIWAHFVAVYWMLYEWKGDMPANMIFIGHTV